MIATSLIKTVPVFRYCWRDTVTSTYIYISRRSVIRQESAKALYGTRLHGEISKRTRS